jgi:hypothetical protein
MHARQLWLSDRGHSRRLQAWQAYLAFGAAGVLFYLLVAPMRGNAIFFNALGLTSWLAVIVGIRRNRPS